MQACTRTHACLHSPSSLSLPLPPNGLKSPSDWVALRISEVKVARCVTPRQTHKNLSCQSPRRNFWITLDQVRLEMTKQGVKNDTYTSLISLVRYWYLDGMGIKIKLFSYNNKANLRDLLAATALVISFKLDSNYRFFSPCDLEIWCMTSKNNRALLLYYIKLCASFKSIGEFKLESQSRNAQFGLKLTIFVLCDLEIWWMTLKNNRAPLLYHIKFRASFQIHQWSQTCVTVRKRPIRIKIGDFLLRVTLKFYGWPWKTIGHLFYTALSSVLFLSCVTLKFDGWPWKTIGHLSYATSSFGHHFIAISQLELELQSGNAQFGSKSMFFLAMWPWNLTDDVEKQ